MPEREEPLVRRRRASWCPLGRRCSSLFGRPTVCGDTPGIEVRPAPQRHLATKATENRPEQSRRPAPSPTRRRVQGQHSIIGAVAGWGETSEEPDLDASPGGLAWSDRPLPRLQVIDTVVGRLRNPSPGTSSKHSFHSIKRGLDEIVYVPSLVDVSGRGGPELHPHGEPRLVRRGQHATRKHGSSDGCFQAASWAVAKVVGRPTTSNSTSFRTG